MKEARVLEGFKEGVRLGNETVDVLLFVDDMVLVADCGESLQVNLKKLDEALTKWEMKMNWSKTEVMKVGRERGHCCGVQQSLNHRGHLHNSGCTVTA